MTVFGNRTPLLAPKDCALVSPGFTLCMRAMYSPASTPAPSSVNVSPALFLAQPWDSEEYSRSRGVGVDVSRPFPTAVRAANFAGWFLIFTGIIEAIVGAVIFNGEPNRWFYCIRFRYYIQNVYFRTVRRRRSGTDWRREERGDGGEGRRWTINLVIIEKACILLFLIPCGMVVYMEKTPPFFSFCGVS